MKGFAILGLLMAGVALGQGQWQSEADLTKFLASPRPEYSAAAFFLECVTTDAQQEADTKHREAAESLVRLGSAAVPDIEKAMDSLEPYGAWWLLHAYARIQGPAALPRLRAVAKSPKLASLQYVLADSIALSLGLTGYVSGPEDFGGAFLCRAPRPGDALGDFLLAWEMDGPSRLLGSLGPRGNTVLDAVPKELLHGKPEAMRRWDTASTWRLPGRGRKRRSVTSAIPRAPRCSR